MTTKIQNIRLAIYQCLEGSSHASALGKMVRVGLVALILLNVVSVAMESVDWIAERYEIWFDGFLIFSMVIFATEYTVRIWSCSAHPTGRYRQPFLGRLRYAFTPLALLDLAAILPLIFSLFPGVDLRMLRIFRMLWLLKVLRYLPAIATITQVFHRQRKTLLAALVVMVTTLFIASTLMYLAERDVQPDAFASIPQAMWWGMTTLTTVGYGDVVPTSVTGRVMGMIIMFLGIAMFALPTAILATAFIEESKRADFLVTWNLVAGVPFFSKLMAEEIAKVAEILKPRTAMPNEVLFQRDEPTSSMYFILSGQVEVELIKRPVLLGRGEFFGEVGLLQNQHRSATVIARTYMELLELAAADFHHLLGTNAILKQKIEAVVKERIARAPS